MRDSLNKIAEDIAFALGKQDNITFRESIKHTINIHREKLLREDDFNSGLNYNDFTQNIVMSLKDWEHPICGKGRITKEKIPDSVRFKSRGRVNYYYVGTSDYRFPFTQTTFAEWEFVKHLRYNTTYLYYVVEDGKIIILNNFKLCDIAIKGIFSNPSDLVNICDNLEQVNDDAPYPISGDMLSTIRKFIISGEFPIRIMDEEGVVTSNSDNAK